MNKIVKISKWNINIMLMAMLFFTFLQIAKQLVYELQNLKRQMSVIVK